MANDPTQPSKDDVSAGGQSTLPTKFLNMISAVRVKLRDHRELNRLVAGEESSDRQIAFALVEVLEEFNNTPPIISGLNYTVSTFPYRTLLLEGAVVKIIESLIPLQIRNHLVYTDGQGVSGGVSDKYQALMGYLNYAKQDYQSKLQRYKVALNINRALNVSHIGSEYALIDTYFDEREGRT